MDILFFCDAFENYWNLTYKSYGLDTLYYCSIQGLAFDLFLKMSRQPMQVITNGNFDMWKIFYKLKFGCYQICAIK